MCYNNIAVRSSHVVIQWISVPLVVVILMLLSCYGANHDQAIQPTTIAH